MPDTTEYAIFFWKYLIQKFVHIDDPQYVLRRWKSGKCTSFTVYRSKSTVRQKTVAIRLEFVYNVDADISSETENSL